MPSSPRSHDDSLPEPWQRLLEWARWVGPRKIVTTVAVVVTVIVVAWWMLKPAAPDVESALGTLPVDASVEASADPLAGSLVPPTPPSSEFVVHVAGSVVTPGVVRVAAGARVIDAIDAAGGPLPRAALDTVNLAAAVVDGERVYVPAVGEVVVPPIGESSESIYPIDLNRADEATLDQLPGVGPATAAAIVDYRTSVGGFVSVDDLLNVPGIGPAKVSALRDLVSV